MSGANRALVFFDAKKEPTEHANNETTAASGQSDLRNKCVLLSPAIEIALDERRRRVDLRAAANSRNIGI
jgi:hypothetical protein